MATQTDEAKSNPHGQFLLFGEIEDPPHATTDADQAILPLDLAKRPANSDDH